MASFFNEAYAAAVALFGSSTKVEEVDQEQAVIVKPAPCTRLLPVPLGSTLVAIYAIVCSVPFVVRLEFVDIPNVIFLMLRLVWRKYYEYTKEEMAKEGANRLCAPFNWFLPYYLAGVVVILLLWAVFLVVLPFVIALLAAFLSAQETYDQSYAVQMAMTDDGFFAGLLDKTGLTDSSDEAWAEEVAARPCGVPLLVLGDLFLLTGMKDGVEEIGDAFVLWTRVFYYLGAILGGALAAEEATFFGIEINALPIDLILNKAPKTIQAKVQADRAEDHKKRQVSSQSRS